MVGGLLLSSLYVVQIPHRPQIRLIDGYSEQPIAAGQIQYTNQDGFDVRGFSNKEGVVQLNVGRRRLYEAIYQLNDEQRIIGSATGYLPNVSRLHMRTWYWLMDLPLYTGFLDTLDIVVVDVENLDGVAGEVMVDCMDCLGRNHWDVVTDESGHARIPIDERWRHRLITNVPGAIPLDTLIRGGDSAAFPDTLRVMFPVDDEHSTTEDGPGSDESVVYCPDRVLVFQVCNSNEDRDDLFEVFVNGSSIGTLDLTSDDPVSTIFIGTTGPVTILEKDFVCPLEFAEIKYFNSSFVRKGHNIIELRNLRSVENGNKGTIGVRNYEVTPAGITNPCRVADILFHGSSGDTFNKSFVYEECCPFDEGIAPSE